MKVTVHNTQLIILKEQLIAKVEIHEFPQWLGHIEIMVKTNSKNLIAAMISQLKDLKRYDVNNQDIKIGLWNNFIKKLNIKYNTDFTCFAELILNDKESEQVIKESNLQSNNNLSLNDILDNKNSKEG